MGCSAWGWDTQQMDMGCRKQGLGGVQYGDMGSLDMGKGVQDAGYGMWMWSGGYRIWDLWIWDKRCRIWDLRCGVVAMGCGIRGAGYGMCDIGYGVWDVGYGM